ncbi:ubiquitin thioesterase otulin isoform X5 [Rissa tridactyla]|uniref:ubiquitin thioesterase otulin isoform X5 n=1 Tax=Rissa tridactyla TaxID=75485 RepID=UPI0023BAA9C6|nr:ubiquitin thioesterase otulin isoform X5 [Rissa tridactyla]
MKRKLVFLLMNLVQHTQLLTRKSNIHQKKAKTTEVPGDLRRQIRMHLVTVTCTYPCLVIVQQWNHLRTIKQVAQPQWSAGTKHCEEDMYRDAEEIEREKILLCETSSSEYKLSVAPEMDIMEYCRKEWRGNTPVAKRMTKGYEAVAQKFASIRRVRGDNYCALRATLFQALSQATQLPSWLQSEDFTMLSENLLSKYDWIKQWQLKQKLGRKMGEISEEIKEYLILLRKKWKSISEIKGPIEKQQACDKLFKNEEEEYSLYEALKFLMLNTAIELYNDDKNGRRVPVFSWLLFARDTSSNPCQLMHNHLNHIGHSGGLEQVEMFLLAYALQYTIQVYRLYKYSTDEFITLYPNDPEEDWPVVTLITEDDRHYNIPVRMCQETML